MKFFFMFLNFITIYFHQFHKIENLMTLLRLIFKILTIFINIYGVSSQPQDRGSFGSLILIGSHFSTGYSFELFEL